MLVAVFAQRGTRERVALFVAAIAGYARSSATTAKVEAAPIAAIFAVFICPQDCSSR